MSVETKTEPEVLYLRAEALRNAQPSLALYEAAYRPLGWTAWDAVKAVWTAVGVTAFIWLAWAEPFSARAFRSLLAAGRPSWLVDYVLSPLVMGLRGVLFVESFGYVYHRFFQHLGWLTRRAQFFRRNQKFHWIHHMILYPIGRFYRRQVPYVSSEGGLGASWLIPSALVAGLSFVVMGAHLGTVAFLGAATLYAMFPVDKVHELFHETSHSWEGNRYVQWLEEIHLLHHWDQRYNFTIVHPFMDFVFGTYLAPRTHRRELEVCLGDRELTVSDLINWRYLLIEATPAEHAAFITQARRHPRSLRKVGHLMEILRHRCEAAPKDSLARELRLRAADLLNEVGAAEAAA